MIKENRKEMSWFGAETFFGGNMRIWKNMIKLTVEYRKVHFRRDYADTEKNNSNPDEILLSLLLHSNSLRI